MNKPTRSIELVVWSGLCCVLLAIVGSFLVAKLRTRGTITARSLPVMGAVEAFTLTNQLGQAVSLEDLRGHVWVADIIFTRCPGPCAKMTREMRSLQDAVSAKTGVRFISLTADPGNDTPAVLKQYGEKHGAYPDRWSFLTGNQTDLYRVATRGLLLAVEEIKPEARQSEVDMFIHSTRFAIVDRNGRVRAALDGADPESRPKILATIEALLKERRE